MNGLVNQQRDEEGLRELALFAGAGGGILGGHLLGWRAICAVEYNAYARSVLLARQNDGTFPPFPIWDDVCTFDGKPWRGIVDVVSGGFPCQDISAAGKGAGMNDNSPAAAIGCTRTVRTLVDGSMVIQIEIDPRHARDAFMLFGSPGTPVALARITPEAATAEARKELEPERAKGGALCKLAAILCGDTEFHEFLKSTLRWAGNEFTSIDAAQIIRETCGITSRADLDNNPEAAVIFHRDFRIPFLKWCGNNK